MDLGLTDRVAIVTGAGRGIGKAVALKLAEEGCDVALVARSRDQLEAAAAEIAEQTGRAAVACPADMTSANLVDRMVEAVVERFGRIDALVNCAGKPIGVATGRLATVTDEDQLLDLDTKYMGYLRCARAVAPHMQAAGYGRMVHIGGMSGRSGAIYSGARNIAIAQLSKALSEEFGQYGITSNVVHPGQIRVEWYEEMVASRAAAENRSREEIEAERAQNNATRRIVEAEELADVIAFLASPRSIAITGETIAADGGSQRAVSV
jgi:NAD(P)-dependent dehydrogenase (short-subunit alcohol dehydrogenase family)